MKPESPRSMVTMSHLVLVRSDPAGQYCAQLVGLPEIHATAATREEALQKVRTNLEEWLASGQLVAVEVPVQNPLLKWFGWADPKDPNEQAYLEELARLRREDLERTLKDHEQKCLNSSSTPTT